MDATTQAITTLVILTALALVVVLTQFVRRRPDSFMLRRLRALEILPTLAAASVEAGRPIGLSVGTVGLGGDSSILSLAVAEIAYQMALGSVYGDRAPLVTTADPRSLPLLQDTFRRAYAQQGKRAPLNSVRWYPAGTRSFAYAAAVSALQGSEDASAQVIAGQLGPELALIAEASLRRRHPVIAASAQLGGQAVAYAFSTEPLIGEELFQAGAYLSGKAIYRGSALALDVLRWLLVVSLILIALSRVINGGG